jgi:hypothetical protein
MTNPHVAAEMNAIAREARDGFLIEQWTQEADVYGCRGHVDRQRFLEQYRWLCSDLFRAPELADEVTVDRVEHRYMLVETGEYSDEIYRWWVADETKPQTHCHVQTRAVTADDHGAEPVTMLDL